jgi:hypothetical protein
MIWDDSDFNDIFAAVWRDMRIARPFPTHCMPLPRHTSRALGIRYRRPTIRSWLGNRRLTGTKPHYLKGTIMKKLLALTLVALTLSTTAAACTSERSSALPTRSPSVTASPVASPERCEEDMPCWDPEDCAEIGNHICGTADDAAAAWAVWDRENGAAKLKLDPSRPSRVAYMASSETYPENLDTYDLALVGKDGRWYVFRAEYLDTPEETGNVAESPDRS